ncbi:MAG: transposase domain-containing protein [Pseudomonadota bacterium]
MTEADAIRIPVAAAAPLLGISARTLQRRLEAGMYDAIRDETDRRAPFLVLLSSLPEEAQKKYRAEQGGALVPCRSESTQLVPFVQPAPAANAEPDPRYSEWWAWYEKLDTPSKDKAKAALEAMTDFNDAREAGVSIGMAEAAVTQKHAISKATLWRYRNDVDGHPRGHWLPLLAPRYFGNRQEAEFTEEAYNWILDKFMCQSEPNVKFITDEARRHGKSLGWKIPSTKTVKRKLDNEPASLTILGREGPKALEASLPTSRRDWSTEPLHTMWESDGCRMDVVAIWPDGTTGRPFIVTWRECRSRKVLSCKGYKNPNGALVMISFRDAVVACGLKPKKGKIDSGREYANKPFTGRQKTRYRFTINPGEPMGVATMMGVEMKWSEPGKARDKNIESWHRLLHQRVCKSPEFAGGYCGKDPVSKPEEFDKRKAIPIELIGRRLAEFIRWYNSEHTHRGNGMHGRTPDAVYGELLPAVDIEEHRPDPAHLRLLLMAVKTLKPDSEGVFHLTVNGYSERRYYNEAFARLPLNARQRPYAVWYHAEDPTAHIAVHDGERYICDCAPIDDIPAIGAGDAAAAWKKDKSKTIASVKTELKAVRTQAPALLPSADVGIIEPPQPAKPEAQKQPLFQQTGTPGELLNTETKRVIRRLEKPEEAEDDSIDWDKLAELKRLQAAKRAVG